MTANRPTISAIVIVWEGIDFVPGCLQTLLDDLDGISYEVIVVDNGSTDGSPALVRERFPSVRLIENKRNLGFARAVNIGIETSRGKYLYILNQDLRFRKGATAGLLDRLMKEPGLGMVGPSFVDFNGRLLKSARAFPGFRHVFYGTLFLDVLFPRHREFSGWRMGWFDHRSERYVDQPMGAVMLIPRAVVDRIGIFDESFPLFFNDVDYCRRMEIAGYQRLYFPDAVVEHHVGASTGRRPYSKRVRSSCSMYRYLRKYSRWYQRPLLWLCGLILLVGLVLIIPVDIVKRVFSSSGTSSVVPK